MGQGPVKPVEAKTEAISDFPVLSCKRQLVVFLVWPIISEFFVIIFSVIAEPMTNLFRKRTRFKWTCDCQNALIN